MMLRPEFLDSSRNRNMLHWSLTDRVAFRSAGAQERLCARYPGNLLAQIPENSTVLRRDVRPGRHPSIG
jgi:hypothetical protein